MGARATGETRLRDGVRAAAPLAPGPLLFGASFGLLATEAGFGTVAAVVMSATTFAGAAQFAAASVLDAGGAALAAVLAAALLNARYLPIGVSVASVFPGGWPRRLLESQLIVDESWAISSRGGRFDHRLLVGAGLLLYVGWVAGTAVGALFGSALGDPEALGVDAAFPALFLALLWPLLRDRRSLAAAALAAAIALVLIAIAPPGVPIVAAAAAVLLGLRR